MIKRIKKEKMCNICTGKWKVVDLSKFQILFFKEMMGEGVGLIFEGDILFAPLDGKLNWLLRLNMLLDLKQIIKQKF